jgi:hypothetical protein
MDRLVPPARLAQKAPLVLKVPLDKKTMTRH